MRILGIDPGLASIGWGIIQYPGGGPHTVAWGQLTTAPATPLPQRLLQIHDAIVALIADQRPQAVAIEELFFATNVKTAIAVAQARGVILLAAAHGAAPVFEYTPLQIKKSVTGRGQAPKIQVQKMVATLLALPEIPRPDHAADALAAALCHAHTLKTERIFSNLEIGHSARRRIPGRR